MSPIFERVLDAFKFIRFPPNFKHSSLRAREDHPYHQQGHQPQSGTSKSSSTPTRTLKMSLILFILRKYTLRRLYGEYLQSLKGSAINFHPHFWGETILMFLTEAGVLDVILDDLLMF